MNLILEQALNGIQYGVTLFLLAAGLSLIFGIMGVINLAHGSFYMAGAYAAALAASHFGSFWFAIPAAVVTTAVLGVIAEYSVMRRLYARNHLEQVLATFALILIANQATLLLFGRQPLFVNIPVALSGSIELLPGVHYPVYRLAIVAAGLVVAAGLYVLINHTRAGMLVRAGATHRDMVRALGVNIRLLYTAVFALGATLAGLAGALAGPILSVQVGMGEQILIIAFVIVVIGGVGSIRAAFLGALLIGMVDTMLRAFGPGLMRRVLAGPDADALAAGLSSMGIYVLMAAVLLLRPDGLFVARR